METSRLIEVAPHPYKADHRIVLSEMRRDATADFGDKPIVRVIMTTGSEDRHGSVFDPNGWDFSAYKRNPVVLWSHMTKIPLIGTARTLERDGEQWVSEIEFAVDAWREFGGGNLAALIYRLMKDDKMRAMSHGFIPKKWEDRKATTIPSFFAENVRYTNTELTEQSPVNVPSNREAVRSAVGTIITENEADFLLGFGFSLHADAPVDLRHIKQADLKAAAKGAKVVMIEVAATREIFAERLRCCGYVEPCVPEEPEELTPDQQATEIQILSDVAANALELVGLAVAGWKNAVHDDLRNYLTGTVYSAMWTFNYCCDLADRWFGVELDLEAESNVTQEDLNGFTTSAPDTFQRAGKVLSAANKSKVQNAVAALNELLAAAETIQQADESDSSDDGRAMVSFTREELTSKLNQIFGGRPTTAASDATAPSVDDDPARSTDASPGKRTYLSLLPLKK
jgi:hypothetical protein